MGLAFEALTRDNANGIEQALPLLLRIDSL
jgi:hypothetical protein